METPIAIRDARMADGGRDRCFEYVVRIMLKEHISLQRFLSVSELCRAFGIPPSSAHLSRAGMVVSGTARGRFR